MKMENNKFTWLHLVIKKLSVAMCISLISLHLIAQSQFIGINELVISRDTSTPTLFMTGEAHGYSSNHSVEAAYIKYLSLNHNVRTILREEGYGFTYLLRKYLDTGDTIFLDLFISDGPFNFEETKRFVLALKQINDQLPWDNKLNLIPIDVTENDRQPYVKKLFKIVSNWEVHNQLLKQEIDSLIESEHFPHNIISLKKTLNNYQINLDYTSDLDGIVGSYIRWQSVKNNLFRQREYYLYKNILQAQPFFKGNIYGNFGYNHTDIKTKCMAYYLKNDTFFRYRLSISNSYYYNCINTFFYRGRQVAPQSKGLYHRRYFKRNIKLAKLQRGIYLTKVKDETYIIHVNQPEMSRLK